MQREIRLSVPTHLHILCPEGSYEVTKSSVRMQEIHFQSKQMCCKKVLFQSHAVLFLSILLLTSHSGLSPSSSPLHHLYVEFSMHGASFRAQIKEDTLFISLSTCINSLYVDVYLHGNTMCLTHVCVFVHASMCVSFVWAHTLR